MIFGFDLDNTIVCYDKLFKKVALEEELIPNNLYPFKDSIKNYLINNNKEKEWTMLQGKVYGARVSEAEVYEGIKEVFKLLTSRNISIYIISHKTKYPFLGEKINLHKSALSWLENKNFFNDTLINLSKKNVFFEESKDKKIKRIINLNCNFYIDDLIEILEKLPNKINKFLFSPLNKEISINNINIVNKINNWKNFLRVINNIV